MAFGPCLVRRLFRNSGTRRELRGSEAEQRTSHAQHVVPHCRICRTEPADIGTSTVIGVCTGWLAEMQGVDLRKHVGFIQAKLFKPP